MADPEPRFTKTPPKGETQGTTVGVAADAVKSIYVYLNESETTANDDFDDKQGGTVSFVGSVRPHPVAVLTRVWFPAGVWHVTLDAQGAVADLKCEVPKDIDQELIDALKEHSKREQLIQWAQKKDVLDRIDRMLAAARGKTFRVTVSYTKDPKGNSKSLPQTLPLTRGDNSLLANPEVARMYLLFVEHFGRVPVDLGIALDGLTETEVATIEGGKQEIIDITNLFIQILTEFNAAKDVAPPPPVDLENFRGMAETIFEQKAAKNDLARRNQLSVAIGKLQRVNEAFKIELVDDIGVRRLSANGDPRLLYDRNGMAVRSFNGPLDVEFREIDLAKIQRQTGIPFLSLEIEDKGLYLFLRNLEQTFGDPLREVEALAVSLYKHTVFITNEMSSRYKGVIAKRIIEFAPAVIGFFVVHAVASKLIARGHPAAAAFLALCQAAGLIFGIDLVLVNLDRMAEAGSHFHKMEELDRDSGDGKVVLSQLSQEHLRLGSAALLDAIADIIAIGVFAVGAFTIRVGPAMVKGLANSASARVRLFIEKNIAVRIETVKGETKIKLPPAKPLELGPGTAPAPKPADLRGIQTKERAAQPEPAAEEHTIEQDGHQANKGRKRGDLKDEAKKQEVRDKIVRPRALDMTADQLEADPAAQKELFDACVEAVARQNAVVTEILAKLNITNAKGGSQIKRDNLGDFIKAVLAKVREKGYKTVGEMPDMIRGRLEFDDPTLVAKVARALKNHPALDRISVKDPFPVAGVEGGYPRYHVDVRDPAGMAHEWQVGPQQVTPFYETAGIDVGKVTLEVPKRNIHDVEYRIFKGMDEPPKKVDSVERARRQAIAQELGIHDYRVRVAEFGARLGRERIPDAELQATTKQFIDEAGPLLRRLVDRLGGDPEGVKFVESLLR